MRSRNIFASFNYAIQGVVYTLGSQRNMKIHSCGALVLILAVALNVSRLELIALFLTVGMVITR